MRGSTVVSARSGVLMLAVFCAGALSALAGGNIDGTNKYAWAENAGWINLGPTNGGVTVHVSDGLYLSCYAWAENVGWIKLGNDNGGPYQNTATNNWGVYVEGTAVKGFAWGENCGWIKFNPTHSQVRLDWESGLFSGYAWAENLGWVHFSSAVAPTYGVYTTAKLPRGSVFILR